LGLGIRGFSDNWIWNLNLNQAASAWLGIGCGIRTGTCKFII
jgi:hypothetical protein